MAGGGGARFLDFFERGMKKKLSVDF